MKIPDFETERFFTRYEFSTPWQLCNSDCESMTLAELLDLAGDSLEAFGRERLIYTETQGSLELREAIAAGHEQATADDVVVLGTPVEGIYLAARALLEPGDEVIVLKPAYDALVNVFEHVVGKDRVKAWHFHAGPAGWELDLDELDRLLSPSTRLVVVNFPHNPTGYLPSPDMQARLVRRLDDSNTWLFYDEMYYGLVHEGTPAIPPAADLSARCLTLSGLSKTHGLPGLRCGWLIVRDAALRGEILNWKFYTSICPPVPTEYLARAALRVQDRLRDRSLERIARNLDVADAFFARWPDRFRWRRPLAGSTALVGFDVPSVDALAARLARKEGILIQSARMLGGDDRHMRIGLGRADFPKALARFEDWLERAEAQGEF